MRSEVPDTQKQNLYKKAIMIAIGGNLLLALFKGVLAWFIGSSAIFSDAANSLSDTLYSILMGMGLYLSQRPADESHPQGHSRFEPLVSLFVAAAMTTAGATAVWQSIRRFTGQAKSITIGWPTVVLLLAVLIKIVMYLRVKKIGDKAHSPAINASAYDNLVDILASLAALIGVWGSRFIHPYFDPAAGLFVGLWIFKATFEIISENLGYLTGRGASEELITEIANKAGKVEKVDGVHRVIAEYVGPQLRIDMHINLDGQLTLDEVHDIGERVKEVVEEIKDVDLVFVHIEPTYYQENY
ncbi:MAG: cation diffusion facilitator family transporter [Halothermotrichaceae bacterium]